MKSHDRKRPVASAGQEKTARTAAPTGLMGVQASSGNQVVLEMMRRGHEEEGRRHGEAVQRSVGGATTVQRAGPTEQEGAEAAGPAQEADPKGKEIISRLSQSIEQHTTQTSSKANVFAPGTWWPEQWMVEGPSRLRKTLERRVMRGEAFSDEELDDIRQLSTVNAKWLKDVGIGSYEEAATYAEGPFDNWLKLDPGKRVLTATLAIGKRPDIVADVSAVRAPTDPAYTLGRFMLTQTPGTDPQKRENLETERDQQIRDTAVDTLHPEGIAPERMHDGSVPAEGAPVGKDGKKKAPDYVEKDAQGREMLTKILLILRHGLQLYDPEKGRHVEDHEQDVIRALSHGGRVNVRIPALSAKGDPAYWLPHFLGATTDATEGDTAEHVSERGFATHRTDIGPNKGGKQGEFKERGGVAASLTNKLAVGAARPKLWGQDISGGGLGSKDWNGAMVLPNGSYGHVLLVYHRPTMEKDGSLQIGVETIAPHAASPVGYEHDFRSTEATSNPESILHGHKKDKIGSGGLSKNERYVDLQEMGADSSGGWQGFLEDIKQQWDRDLAGTDDNADERRALYQELVGKRPSA
ncbi:PE-PGRS family protein [Streptomyces sp. DT9]